MHLFVSGAVLALLGFAFKIIATFVEFLQATWLVLLLVAFLVAGGIVVSSRRRNVRSRAGNRMPTTHSLPEPGGRPLDIDFSSSLSSEPRASCNTSASTPRFDANNPAGPTRMVPRFVNRSATFAPGIRELGKFTAPPSRGLVIMPKPLEDILSGVKSMELRSKPNRKLGPIALIRKGSGQIFGVAEIFESVGPMSFDEFCAWAREHAVEQSRLAEVYGRGWVYGWRMRNIIRLMSPVGYVHKGMSQVNLDPAAVENLRRALDLK